MAKDRKKREAKLLEMQEKLKSSSHPIEEKEKLFSSLKVLKKSSGNGS